jgi:hypothetical protein
MMTYEQRQWEKRPCEPETYAKDGEDADKSREELETMSQMDLVNHSVWSSPYKWQWTDKRELFDHLIDQYPDDVVHDTFNEKLALSGLQNSCTFALYGECEEDDLIAAILRNQEARKRGYWFEDEDEWFDDIAKKGNAKYDVSRENNRYHD